MSLRIEHRLGIPAPAQAVWEVLADLRGWKDWNPVYPSAQGQLRIGERLTLVERAGDVELTINPSIVDWVPLEQILWRISHQGGMVRRLRFLEIEALTDEGCIFSNGEIWDGRLVRFTGAQRRRQLRDAYAAMSEALSAEVLNRWRRGDVAPT